MQANLLIRISSFFNAKRAAVSIETAARLV